MTWILHFCTVGWLGGCSSIVEFEYPTEQACDKALVIIERQAKEQQVKYRVLCKPARLEKP